MATIGATVDPPIKQQFEEAARARNLTASRLAAELIIKFLEGGQGAVVAPASSLILPPPQPVPQEAKTKQVFVRLQPYHYMELGRLAAERKWYPGTYLGNLFCAHLERRPVLCEAEINALRQVARQLADMGRNINQIAKQLNASAENAHLAFAMDLDLQRALIELETSVVKNLVRANLKGWGVTDAEA
jgi:hypothetical protein